MSILIKGMSMPKNCNDCNFQAGGWCFARSSEPYFSDWCVSDVSDRPPWCPLVELPPYEPKWIPVTERLPLYGQDVLAVRTYGDGEKCQEVLMAHIAVWNEETGEKWWNATNITHWMPLPQPPTESEE